MSSEGCSDPSCEKGIRPWAFREVTLIELRETGPGFNILGLIITIKAEFKATIDNNRQPLHNTTKL